MAMLGLLAVAVMAFAYVVTSRLNAASQFAGQGRAHNAKVLNQAKQALVGWVAMNAAGADQNPGRLPCPEAPGYFGDPSQEGIAAGSCTLPAVGRLPWRTLGLDRLVDSAGEPLWYAVSPGWALPNSTATLTINPDSSGQLSLDGGEAVALVIAPGPAINAQAGAGCTAWAQTRPAAGPPDLRNYLECENATSPADAAFVGNRPDETFNDHVLRVSAADVMPALEAAIAERMQREIAPRLRSVFRADTSSPPRWIAAPANAIEAGSTTAPYPVYPYAAPFANPGPGSGTSDYRGVSGTYQGLLPFNQTQGCTASSSNPRCLPSLVSFNPYPDSSSAWHAEEVLGYGYILWQNCSETADERLCEGRYHEYDPDPTRPIRIQMTSTFASVAMGLRKLDPTRLLIEARDDGSSGAWVNVSPAYRAEMNDGSVSGRPRGSVTMRFWGTLPNIDAMGWGTQADFRIRIQRAVIGDHELLDPTHATLGWYTRNEWFRNTYYATAQMSSPDGLPSTTGCDSTNCLRVNDSATRNIRALLVLAGQGLPGQTRPSNSVADYLENQNADGGTLYEQRPVRRVTMAANANAPWNDRIVLVDWSAPLQEPLQVIDDNIPAVPVRVATLP